jgi:hypothetical protein
LAVVVEWHHGGVFDVNGLGRTLPRVRVQDDGLLLRPWFRRSLLVPWRSIKGVRIAPVDQWSGRGAAAGDHGCYMIQVKLAGQWRRVGGTRRVDHAVLPLAVREELFGERGSRPISELILHDRYEMIRTRWEKAGGRAGDEDDNWPRLQTGRSDA